MDRDKVLKTLNGMTVDQIDRLRDSKLIEYENLMVKYYKLKEDELTLKHEKRKQYLEDGNSLSKTESLMRSDEDVYLLKLELMKLKPIKLKLELLRELLNGAFWKARNQ